MIKHTDAERYFQIAFTAAIDLLTEDGYATILQTWSDLCYLFANSVESPFTVEAEHHALGTDLVSVLTSYRDSLTLKIRSESDLAEYLEVCAALGKLVMEVERFHKDCVTGLV